jgi:hypothetical protein
MSFLSAVLIRGTGYIYILSFISQEPFYSTNNKTVCYIEDEDTLDEVDWEIAYGYHDGK